MNASIGVTSGKAYCGNVGSPSRHEFAVMGASTCLSARLMCKAKPQELLCDEEVRSRDRSHVFNPLGTVQAKGYSKPVAIFSPNLKQENTRLSFTRSTDQDDFRCGSPSTK